MSLQQKLNKLKKSELVHLIIELFGRYKDIDQIIANHTGNISTKDTTLQTILQQQLLHIGEDSSFIDYHLSSNYAASLLNLLMDINTLLREQSPEQALQATESFVLLHESVLKRADDSNGELSQVFRESVDQWLDIAEEVRNINPQPKNWLEKILGYFESNDYGVFDDIIRNSNLLLTEDELAQLAQRFEAQAKKAQRAGKDKGYNRAAANAIMGMQSVAEAKGDINLFEKYFLLTNPKPNALQLKELVTYAISIENFNRAEYWLGQNEWQEDLFEFKNLRNKLLKAQGNVKQLKKNLADDFYQNPNELSLEDFWQVATKTEQDALYKKMPNLVKDMRNVDDAIAMAFFVKHNDLAENLLLEHGEKLTELYYATFLNWLERLDKTKHPLACVVCYRCLLSNLLNRGYAKAYHHGADYFHMLLTLDRTVEDYKNLEDAQSYILSLQEKHWRKSSFWRHANYPNKP